MTNFEKIIQNATVEDMADALSSCFEGECCNCPARVLCEAQSEDSSVGCTDVMKLWLEQEAEGDSLSRLR